MVDIQINSRPISFELENEKSVSDIIHAVLRWAGERDLIFVEANIDNNTYQVDSPPELDLGGVRVINCIVQSKADVVIAALEEGMAYCDRVVRFLDGVAPDDDVPAEHAHSIARGIEWLIEALSKIFSLLCADFDGVRYRDGTVGDFVRRLSGLKRAIDDAGPDVRGSLFMEAGGLLAACRDVLRLLHMSDDVKNLVIKSVESPDVLLHMLEELRAELPAKAGAVADAAAEYQSGRDSIGSEKLEIFLDFIYRYTRVCHQVAPVFQIDLSSVIIGDVSLEQKNAEIMELLNHVLAAFENNDIISLSDALEYEIMPELENLESYINKLIDAINAE